MRHRGPWRSPRRGPWRPSHRGPAHRQTRASYELARAKAGSGSLAALAALDIGYTWEAEKNYDAAEKAYQSVISGAKPKDFLYEEAMVGIARVHELGRKP